MMNKRDDTIKCSICGCELLKKESCVLNERILCKDCYMEETHPVKICNPLPVMAAKKLTGNYINLKDNLAANQKILYNYIIENEKTTIEQLCNKFNLTEVKLKNQLAILRHLELIKGKKEGDKHYIVPF